VNKPVLLVVDDDPQVLAAVRRDLRSRYREQYTVVSAASGSEALATARELKSRGDSLAMVISDQRMPGMLGGELLARSRDVYPLARRILLTGYSDIDAAIRAINDAHVDHYLSKPWDPPEDKLFPVVDDLLKEWQDQSLPETSGIRLVGHQWATRSHDMQRILLADDNADLRDYARRLLAEQYEVHAVADGQAAIEAARDRRPDLIISDVMTPRLDGFGLIRELRADPELSEIPVVLLSARAGEEARLEGLGKGADDYLVKPFSSRELLVRVGTLMHSAEMHRRAKQARAQFETLLNNAPLGVYLVDDDFRIAAVNPVALPTFGDIPDLIGRDFDRQLWQKIVPKLFTI